MRKTETGVVLEQLCVQIHALMTVLIHLEQRGGEMSIEDCAKKVSRIVKISQKEMK